MNQAPRQRIQLDPEYAKALGTTTYCFAICEWGIAWCAEHVRPGFLNKIKRKKMTAGEIGHEFKKHLENNVSDSPLRDELLRLTKTFLALVEVRNGIAHGQPSTTSAGDQRLHGTQPIEIEDLERAADEFSACSLELNALLHGPLKDRINRTKPRN